MKIVPGRACRLGGAAAGLLLLASCVDGYGGPSYAPYPAPLYPEAPVYSEPAPYYAYPAPGYYVEPPPVYAPGPTILLEDRRRDEIRREEERRRDGEMREAERRDRERPSGPTATPRAQPSAPPVVQAQPQHVAPAAANPARIGPPPQPSASPPPAQRRTRDGERPPTQPCDPARRNRCD